MKPRGIPIAQIDSDTELDSKFQKLARRLSTQDYYAAFGTYMSIVLRAWGTASRHPDSDLLDMVPSDMIGVLRGVGLLDESGSIPEDVFEKWVGSVLAERGRDADRKRLGGAERQARFRLRTRIFERDNYTCRYCGRSDYPRDLLVLEHIDPLGGGDEGNLVTACRPCNGRKGGQTPEEAGMTLLPVTQSNGDVTHNAGESAPLSSPLLSSRYVTVENGTNLPAREDADWVELGPIIVELTGRPYVNRFSGTAAMLVEDATDFGTDRVVATMRAVASAMEAKPDLRALAFGVRNALRPPPDSKVVLAAERDAEDKRTFERRVAATQRRIRSMEGGS